MATTATNKQPLLVDRVFHSLVKANTLTSGHATNLDITGTNESVLLVSCNANDGAIVEDLYVIARSTTAYKILFYLSSSIDYLRPTEAVYVGSVTSSTTKGAHTSSTDLPKILAPLPHVGSAAQLEALYIPKGKNLWATLQAASPVNSDDSPVIGAQGGFY
tara:strand:+ start:145 stop:627 length:483 start_codon:yes stop_codon:yes gene_type:complete